jgi:hypothetical protein
VKTLAYIHGDAIEIFLEGAAAIGAAGAALAVPLVVLHVLKRHTNV